MSNTARFVRFTLTLIIYVMLTPGVPTSVRYRLTSFRVTRKMRLMTTPSRKLSALIEQHQAEHGSTQVAVARRIGVTPKTLIQWRRDGLTGRLPERSVLEAVAATVDVPYREVLDAALADAGFTNPNVQPTFADTLAVAVTALTEATRLRRPGPADSARSGDRIDWAAFICQAVAAAAANGGGTEHVLSGRPGSWEAEHVRAILTSTLGAEDEYLWDHRTDPVTVTLPLAGIVEEIDPTFDENYRRADDALSEPYARALAEFNAAGLLPAPATDFLTSSDQEFADAWSTPTVLTVHEQTLRDLEEREEQLREELREHQIQDLREYGRRLSVAVEARLRPIVATSTAILIDLDPLTEPYEVDVPAAHVDEADGPIEKAVAEAISETAPPVCSAAQGKGGPR